MSQQADSRPLNVWGDGRRGWIGLLGGSFNPAHDGHRFISLTALKQLRLDAVWWLVSPQNPLKARAGMAPQAERIACALQVAAHPRLRVSGMEQAFGTRFTADTLRVLQRRFRRVRFVWLMGADNLVQMPRWQRWQTIFRRVPVAVFDRGNDALRGLRGVVAHRFAAHRCRPDQLCTERQNDRLPRWCLLRQRRHPASATALRAAARSRVS